MTVSTEELRALYAAGQFEKCLQRAHEALVAGSTESWAFLLAAMSLVRLGRTREFADMMRSSGENAVLLAAWACSNLLEEEAYAPLTSVGELFAPEEPLWLAATYFSGCASMMLGRHDQAMARFKAFRLAWPRFAGTVDFIGDDRLNVMLRQGRLVADAEEVERRMSAATRSPLLEFVGAAAAGRPVVFASGNSHYFNAMGSEFVAGMMPFLPTLPDGGEALLHLHVIEPDAESLASIERLRAEHGPRLAFSLEREPLFRTYTYFSCSRFYVMTALLDRYRAPILSFDIDIVPTAAIAPLFETAAPFDFCCFRTRRNEPASIFQASVMYWPDRPATRAFIDRLQHFCWEKLRDPSRTSWMLDQAALFSLLADPGQPVKFGDFAKLIGYPLEQLVRITFTNEIKGQLRHRVERNEPSGMLDGKK